MNHPDVILGSEIKSILGSTLQLGDRVIRLREDTPLIGYLPELDSMAIVSVITALENHYGFTIEDDELTAETFETLGSLTAFVSRKLAR